jgi:hypothetical protein
MRLSLRSVLVSLIALVAIGGAISGLNGAKQPKSSPSQTSWFAVSKTACPSDSTSGVSEFIDFGPSKKVKSFCAFNFSGSGWMLLTSVSKVDGTSDYPVGFACRIDGWPTVESQDCKNTPTYAEGSWAYFLSNQQGGWSFSGTGATMNHPSCGTSEAWVWVAGGADPTAAMPSVKPRVFKCAN